jgi:DNA damage-binding protein 1
MWTLSINSLEGFDNTLVLAFGDQTRVFLLAGKELEETEVLGFLSDELCRHCGNIAHNQSIQLTSISIRLVNEERRELISHLCPADTSKGINLVAVNWKLILCASGSNMAEWRLKAGVWCLAKWPA